MNETETVNISENLDQQLNVQDDQQNELINVQTKIENNVNAIENDDQLDYEEELDENNLKNQLNDSKENKNGENDEDDDDDDGEIKSESEEVKSDKDDKEIENTDNLNSKKEKTISEIEDVEDGEIDDGEKSKKAFIPRILCKYYQRGKCTWGRGCKFLHPGVNDTGNYTFLEVEDPAAKFLPPRQQPMVDDSHTINRDKHWQQGDSRLPPTNPPATETAWERGLRFAKEMKEKALLRKKTEKNFDDKKLNLSLKEFEDEKQFDERHLNIERAPRNDFEDEEIDLSDAAYLEERHKNIRKPNLSVPPPQSRNLNTNDYQNKFRNDKIIPHGHPVDQRSQDKDKFNKRRTKENSPGASKPVKADEWYDYWDRGRQPMKKSAPHGHTSRSTSRTKRTRSYSRSTSTSSKSSHSSRSSYSSRSRSSRSRSSSKSSYSSRSGSRSPSAKKKADAIKPLRPAQGIKTAPKQQTSKPKQPPISQATSTTQKNKVLPGRQVSDIALKKAAAELDKIKRKPDSTKQASKTRSDSSSEGHSRSSSVSSTNSTHSSRSSQSNISKSSQNSGSGYSDSSSNSENVKKLKQKNENAGKTIKKQKSTDLTKTKLSGNGKSSMKEDLKKTLDSVSSKNTGIKRQATEAKSTPDVKKQKISSPVTSSKDKKPSTQKSDEAIKTIDTKAKPKTKQSVQALKEQLKLVESALSKKKAMAK